MNLKWTIHGDSLEGGRWKAENPYVQTFLNNWQQGNQLFSIRTSGSTGTPKVIQLQREHMILSAERSIRHFGLAKGSVAVLCLSPETVGGTMMMVRALVGEWDLHIISPSSNPLNTEWLPEHIDFISMVPSQLHETLKDSSSLRRLTRVKNLLLGGAPLPRHVVRSLPKGKTKIYQGYGMTETLSHIAIREVSKENTPYVPLEGIEVGLNEQGRLLIHMIKEDKTIETNDLGIVHKDGSFQWLGRSDFAINSGGFKIIPELLEEKIAHLLHKEGFSLKGVISSQPDQKWGERVVFVTDTPLPNEMTEIQAVLKSQLKPHEYPKNYFRVDCFPLNASGKLDRIQLKTIISS